MEEIPNHSYITGLVGNDLDFRDKFLALIKKEFSGEMAAYLMHISKEEPRAAAEYVYKLKYKISTLGMDRAFALAEKHEERLQVGDTSLNVEFIRILKKIEHFLKEV